MGETGSQSSQPGNQTTSSSTVASEMNVWTTEDYIRVDLEWRENMKEYLQDYLTIEVLEPGASKGESLSHAKYVALIRRALEHPSPIASMNLNALHWGVFQATSRMDESKTRKNREADPEVDNEAVRPAKFRFIEMLEKEAEKLGPKDMENLIVYMEDVLGGMDDHYYNVRRLGGYKGGKEPL